MKLIKWLFNIMCIITFGVIIPTLCFNSLGCGRESAGEQGCGINFIGVLPYIVGNVLWIVILMPSVRNKKSEDLPQQTSRFPLTEAQLNRRLPKRSIGSFYRIGKLTFYRGRRFV